MYKSPFYGMKGKIEYDLKHRTASGRVPVNFSPDDQPYTTLTSFVPLEEVPLQYRKK